MTRESRLSLLEEALRDEADKPRLRVFVFPGPNAVRDAGIIDPHPRDRVLVVCTGVPCALNANQM
ncbi:MAG: hypothetical protein EBR88_06725 [Betaproteobacteria bacterium]|nr:hypothetical protein [Betaproteobacteria bacterium]